MTPTALTTTCQTKICRNLLQEFESSHFELYTDDVSLLCDSGTQTETSNSVLPTEPLAVLEQCLAEAVHRLDEDCQLAVAIAVPGACQLDSHLVDDQLLVDPSIGNTSGSFEGFLEEMRGYLAVLIHEFRICVAATKFECDDIRIYSDVLAYDSDDDSDDPGNED